MKIAFVGCGYVADFYAATLRDHPDLALTGAYDRDGKNLKVFTERWETKGYASLESLLQDAGIELVLNLTNPRSHYEVTKLCLEAGKHVYSEKPLAMDANAAGELVDLAAKKNLHLSSAPCSMLSETAQTMWKAIKDGAVGKVRLVYANFDDGLIAPKQSPWNWFNPAGVPWPAKDEFEVGCTYEHAGYVLTWLAAFFGPAKSVTSFSSCQLPDKGIAVDKMAPDFTVGCIEYANNVVARVTCGLVAAKDKSLSVFGDDGVIFTNTVRDDSGPVYIRTIPSSGVFARLEPRINFLREKLQSILPAIPWSGNPWFFSRKHPSARKASGIFVDRDKPVDFCTGPSEMAAAIREKRPCRLSAGLGLHITEIVEALQYPERFNGRRVIESTFDPIQPLPWNR